MDSHSPKRSRGGGDEGIVKFGELPDSVLSDIISFLPTKEAIRTSILSKKWEYLWTSIPKLRFVHNIEEPMDFVNIVDSVSPKNGVH